MEKDEDVSGLVGWGGRLYQQRTVLKLCLLDRGPERQADTPQQEGGGSSFDR